MERKKIVILGAGESGAGAAVLAKLKGYEDWATNNNPFFEGPHSDWLGLIPFLVLTVLLYFVGRELLLTPKPYRREE